MPSCSVLGKIFHPISTEDSCINDMLDMKLAIYTPFAFHMASGIFLTSSDDIETFNFSEQIEISKQFSSKYADFILIAHKSSIDIAKDHGCYGLGERKILTKTPVYECEYVLQKPSIDVITKTTLIQVDENSHEKFVYTDSVFFFTHTVIHSLLLFSRLFYESICDYNIEVDAYRDFLQPLGAKPCDLKEYLTNLKCFDGGLKKSLFEDLYKIMLNRRSLIVAMENSIFYHLGTINELLDLYLLNDDGYFKSFRDSVNHTNVKNSYYVDSQSNKVVISENLNSSSMGMGGEKGGEYCLINSLISPLNTKLSSACILEYCSFYLNSSNIKLNINDNCYLNNCSLEAKELGIDEMILDVPANMCLHTIPIRIDEQIKHVTVFFSKSDNLKAVYPSLDKINFLNRAIFVDYKNDNYEHFEKILISMSKPGDPNKFAFWNLRLFKVEDTMSKSFVNAVKFINLYSQCKTLAQALEFFQQVLNEKLVNNCQFLSLFDLLYYCDNESMILYRDKYFCTE